MDSSYTIITGALGGLGCAFAYECASEGTNLILVDRPPDGSPLVDYLSEHFPVDLQYFACDLADLEARSDLFNKLENKNLHYSGLINIVGQEIEGKFLERQRDEVLYMLHLNIEAMIDLSLFALNRLDPSQKFLLINVASLAGFFPIPYKTVYSSTKRLIINFSQALREEIRDFGTVTVLCPGGLPTNPEAMKKIFLQGFWGKITAHDTHHVVRRTLKKARRNVPVFIPGTANNILVFLARFIPASWTARFLSKRWESKKNQLDFWQTLHGAKKN
ncbi:MAG: SDR family NAD(P)-dependent oxidoreductase [Brevefilum sp.]